MSKPRILIIDIETSPNLGYVWSLWNQNISLVQLKEEWLILSFSCKWLGEDEVFYFDNRENIESDKNLLKCMWPFLDQADWVITHNGDKFDIRKIKARMLLNGLDPFSPFKSIDTCKQAKRIFGFTSNKLEYLSKKLCPEGESKLDHQKFAGFKLWLACLNGNEEAWDEMEKYNRQDVTSLEYVYLALRPWMTTHPNMGLFVESDNPVCPKCASDNLVKKGKSYTNVGIYQRYKCKDCKSPLRSRFIEKGIDRSHVTNSNA